MERGGHLNFRPSCLGHLNLVVKVAIRSIPSSSLTFVGILHQKHILMQNYAQVQDIDDHKKAQLAGATQCAAVA